MTTDEFISTYKEEDVRRLALQAAKFPNVDMPFALDQIAGWQTARRKLPSWAAVNGLIYPPHISMEQCSSEATARYKRSLSEEGRKKSEERRGKSEESYSIEGSEKEMQMDSSLLTLHTSIHQQMDSSLFTLNSSLIDLTGGFGVDFSFMSRGFSRAVYVERQPHLCGVARKNFALLGLDNTEVVCGDGVEYLQTIDHATMIYLDPARRDSHGGRTYAISDCTPDVLTLLPTLLSKADRVMVKLSPMLDWHETVRSLNAVCPHCVVEVHIVSVRNECKEMLVVMEKDNKKELTIYCVDGSSLRSPKGGETNQREIGGEKRQKESNSIFSIFSFSSQSILSTEKTQYALSPFGGVGGGCSFSFTPQSALSEATNRACLSPLEGAEGASFLYEPNASIMKAGCFALLSARYSVAPLARNSHLFVSDKAVDDFPGRRFRILATSSMNKKEMKKALSGIDSANITVRNFPLSVAELRKRLKLKDGGDTYIFATTVGTDKRQLIICNKV